LCKSSAGSDDCQQTAARHQQCAAEQTLARLLQLFQAQVGSEAAEEPLLAGLRLLGGRARARALTCAGWSALLSAFFLPPPSAAAVAPVEAMPTGSGASVVVTTRFRRSCSFFTQRRPSALAAAERSNR